VWCVILLRGGGRLVVRVGKRIVFCGRKVISKEEEEGEWDLRGNERVWEEVNGKDEEMGKNSLERIREKERDRWCVLKWERRLSKEKLKS
jgi:hypothetical protein